LAVNETEGRGWWLPGGFVEPGDSHPSAAVRETLEEAGIDIELRGILRVENDIEQRGGRQRVIFYAEPRDPMQRPKHDPDRESLGAAWMNVDELRAKSRLPPPEGLRGTELLDWAVYIEGGGTIYPLSVFASEHEPVPEPRK
jgi:ADP-ribose pyrophosphatase YjhB (NUDIX family)